jgi:adenosylhomocysteine nucleosidase
MAIGIMGAMTEEVDLLLQELEEDKSTVHTLGGRNYHVGTLWGTPVIVVFSHWGKVAAAMTATTLITKFNVSEILFTGIAGAVAPDLNLGDVVIGRQLFQHDMDARPFIARHEIPLLGITALKTCEQRSLALEKAAAAYFSTELVPLAARAARHGLTIKTPKIIRGDIASGDSFFSDKRAIAALREQLPSVSCVEMEGAAVAQVCHEYQIPFSIVRTISDSGDEAAPVDFVAFKNHIASCYSHGILQQLLRRHSPSSS